MSSHSRRREYYGNQLELEVIESVDADLDHVPDVQTELYDARLASTLVSSRTLPLIGRSIAEAGSPIEIKSCLRFFEDSNTRGGRRRGRWHISKESHAELVELDGFYLLTVRDDEATILASRMIHAAELTPLLTWSPRGGSDAYRDHMAVLSWGRVIDPGSLSAEDEPAEESEPETEPDPYADAKRAVLEAARDAEEIRIDDLLDQVDIDVGRAEQALEKLRLRGEVYEPRDGLVRAV